MSRLLKFCCCLFFVQPVGLQALALSSCSNRTLTFDRVNFSTTGEDLFITGDINKNLFFNSITPTFTNDSLNNFSIRVVEVLSKQFVLNISCNPNVLVNKYNLNIKIEFKLKDKTIESVDQKININVTSLEKLSSSKFDISLFDNILLFKNDILTCSSRKIKKEKSLTYKDAENSINESFNKEKILEVLKRWISNGESIKVDDFEIITDIKADGVYDSTELTNYEYGSEIENTNIYIQFLNANGNILGKVAFTCEKGLLKIYNYNETSYAEFTKSDEVITSAAFENNDKTTKSNTKIGENPKVIGYTENKNIDLLKWVAPGVIHEDDYFTFQWFFSHFRNVKITGQFTHDASLTNFYDVDSACKEKINSLFQKDIDRYGVNLEYKGNTENGGFLSFKNDSDGYTEPIDKSNTEYFLWIKIHIDFESTNYLTPEEIQTIPADSEDNFAYKFAVMASETFGEHNVDYSFAYESGITIIPSTYWTSFKLP